MFSPDLIAVFCILIGYVAGCLVMLYLAPRLFPEAMIDRAERTLRARDRELGITNGAYPPSRPTPRKR